MAPGMAHRNMDCGIAAMVMIREVQRFLRLAVVMATLRGKS